MATAFNIAKAFIERMERNLDCPHTNMGEREWRHVLKAFKAELADSETPADSRTMSIFEEKPGVISEGPVWVCIHEAWMYTADTLEQLIEVLNTQWQQDQHLVG